VRRILLVSPNVWDAEELAAPRLSGRYEFTVMRDGWIRFPETIGLRQAFRRFDVLRLIDRAASEGAELGIDGVVGTDEYLACVVAAALARSLHLPGPAPEALLLALHKYYCRRVQREVVPESTAAFTLIDPFSLGSTPPDLEFPMFVKPVRGTCSVLARRVESFDSLRDHLRFSLMERAIARNLMRPFNRLMAQYTRLPLDANFFIGEEVLEGTLVTLEGFVCGRRMEVVGVVDSMMYPGTDSFSRFDYPSRLDDAVKRRMAGIAAALVERIGLDDCLFNVEMFYGEETDRIHVLELNPRMAYQFADLYEKVDGVNSYDILLSLAVGERPRLQTGGGAHAAAASFVLRKFEDARIARLPDAAQIGAVKSLFPGTRIRIYGRIGRRLSDQRGVESYRYAILNMGGSGRADLTHRFGEACRLLTFSFR